MFCHLLAATLALIREAYRSTSSLDNPAFFELFKLCYRFFQYQRYGGGCVHIWLVNDLFFVTDRARTGPNQQNSPIWKTCCLWL